ncbi:MauE/DoxX family redox-associated membrane protein [Aestuariibaculum sediminum]|uniref:MauE/DoxX family redox-associated membrane protein n=1 Tax=Aestuariibaculum sediminum TaxID=2770637 RepID=UPI003743CF19
MKWLQKHANLIIEITCNLLVVLFLYAAISKLLDYQHFKWQLNQSPFISTYSDSLSWIIPITEIGISIALISKEFKLEGLISSLILLGCFTTYIIIILSYSNHIPCSCGGVLSSLGWKKHILFNLSFMFLNTIGILLTKHKKSIARLQGKTENL